MTKFYKVIKENFLWEEGAIISNKKNNDGYQPVNDIFLKHEDNDGEYITTEIIENSPDFFQRVYPVSLLKKTVYKLKEEAKEMLVKEYKD